MRAVGAWAKVVPWARFRPWWWYRCRFRDSRRGVFARHGALFGAPPYAHTVNVSLDWPQIPFYYANYACTVVLGFLRNASPVRFWAIGRHHPPPATESDLCRKGAVQAAAVVVHRGTFSSNARKMLLKPILENGTIRTAITSFPRNQSVWLLTSGLVT